VRANNFMVSPELLYDRNEIVNKQTFTQLKMRWLLIWEILAIVILMFCIIVTKILEPRIDETLLFIIFEYFLYAIPILWLFNRSRRLGTSLKQLWTGFPRKHQWWKLVLVVIFLVFFSAGTTTIIVWALMGILPTLVIVNFSSQELYSSNQTAYPVLSNCLSIVNGLIIAPIVEEVLIRGLLLHRLAIKWNTTIAIILSSLFFGIMHFDFLGAFIFGIIMALLFLKSGKIIVPIIAHSLYNTIKLWFMSPSPPAEQIIPTINSIRSLVWFGVVLIVITTPGIIYFIYKNWPKKDSNLPYFTSS